MNCPVCGKELVGRQKTCSPTCRKKLARGEEIEGIVKGSDVPPLEFISSGIPEIDAITGGFPRKRITEIFGMKGVGKTALMSKIVSNGIKVFYVDTENAMVDVPEHVDILNEDMLENVEEKVTQALSKKYDLIVVDSVASMTMRAEVEGDMNEALMGLKPRLMGKWMRRIISPLRETTAAVVFINQQRESMDPYKPKRFTPGGHALPYAASLRLELRTTKADRVIENGVGVAHWVNFEVEKSRICRPFQKGRFKLEYQ